eukprot:TRINITY_DN2095_c2_g1_i1.p1 TRINITY_DN2095_c2_g1~~TRINITY_DN2095_c2_g1_i1.p1  ORF type:complete len:226 (+),score=37.54 TRINITY_DN2095_c2_g1_i1:92-769(+)
MFFHGQAPVMSYSPNQQPQQQPQQMQQMVVPVMWMPANTSAAPMVVAPMASVGAAGSVQQALPVVLASGPTVVATATVVPVQEGESRPRVRGGVRRASVGAAAEEDDDSVPPPLCDTGAHASAPPGRRGSAAQGDGARADEDKTYTGTVIQFDAVAGYGFVHCKELYSLYGRDIFIHKRQFAGLAIGDRIEFTIVHNNRGQPQVRKPRYIGREPSKRGAHGSTSL